MLFEALYALPADEELAAAGTPDHSQAYLLLGGIEITPARLSALLERKRQFQLVEYTLAALYGLPSKRSVKAGHENSPSFI